MSRDIENATKASQGAELLCQDLRALAVTDNLILHLLVMKELEAAAQMSGRLAHLAACMEKMNSYKCDLSRDPNEIGRISQDCGKVIGKAA